MGAGGCPLVSAGAGARAGSGLGPGSSLSPGFTPCPGPGGKIFAGVGGRGLILDGVWGIISSVVCGGRWEVMATEKWISWRCTQVVEGSALEIESAG